MTDLREPSDREGTVYLNAVELVERFRLADAEVVVDVGCGFGAIAEPLASQGLTYIGFDSNPMAIADLRERSFEAEVIDFGDAEDAVRMVEKRLGDRRLSAVVMVDSLENLANGEAVLAALQRLAVSQGCAPMVLSVPNVTHIDLVGKLLLGRWDMTAEGLLDRAHVAFFSEDRLNEVTRRTGWLQLASADFDLPESDQHFPSDASVLQRGAPLRDLLYQIRNQASSGAIVNEFVRVYAPVSTVPADNIVEEVRRPLLSVLMRTQNWRPATMQESLLSLAAQTCDDFELLILAHDVPRDKLHDLRYLVDAFPPSFAERVRIIPVDGGGRSRPLNVGVGEARGDYIAILDDDDIVFGHWVSAFRDAAERRPGRVLRAVAAEQDVEIAVWAGSRPGYQVVSRPYCRWSAKFDVVEHLIENYSPPCGWAIPRSSFRDLGLTFDETLPVLEDWDVLMQAVLWSGVVSIDEVTALWRRWQVGGDSSTSVHSENEWTRARMAVLAKLDARPLLLPTRSVTKLHELSTELGAAKADRDRLSNALDGTELDRIRIHAELVNAHKTILDIRSSFSWRASAPLRVLGRFARRVLGHQHARASTPKG